MGKFATFAILKLFLLKLLRTIQFFLKNDNIPLVEKGHEKIYLAATDASKSRIYSKNSKGAAKS